MSGQVTDSYDEPLAGASVYIRGHIKDGTSTDTNGYFSIEIPEGKKIIIEASFLGMKPYAVEYTGQKEIQIKMEDDANMMEIWNNICRVKRSPPSAPSVRTI